MDPDLRAESERLTAAWEQHDAAFLRDYLVAGVEDPRLNVQSVLTRHFLIFEASGDRLRDLADAELTFAAVMNWLLRLVANPVTALDDCAAVRFALERGADNAEGIELPPFIRQAWRALPATASGFEVPHYLAAFLAEPCVGPAGGGLSGPVLDTFARLWSEATQEARPPRLAVAEPACGAANDYRFLDRYGLTRWIDYAGFDLCEKNVANARALFPAARFAKGNVFAIDAADRQFDLGFVHDLFEHLSLAGLETAIAEICRVTRRALCLGFFNMDEIPEHDLRPVEHYHWNRLSLARIQGAFARHGFAGQAFHIGTYLRWRTGCATTHNPNAYTLVLERTLGKGTRT